MTTLLQFCSSKRGDGRTQVGTFFSFLLQLLYTQVYAIRTECHWCVTPGTSVLRGKSLEGHTGKRSKTSFFATRPALIKKLSCAVTVVERLDLVYIHSFGQPKRGYTPRPNLSGEDLAATGALIPFQTAHGITHANASAVLLCLVRNITFV